jgi:hypothetical protein
MVLDHKKGPHPWRPNFTPNGAVEISALTYEREPRNPCMAANVYRGFRRDHRRPSLDRVPVTLYSSAGAVADSQFARLSVTV